MTSHVPAMMWAGTVAASEVPVVPLIPVRVTLAYPARVRFTTGWMPVLKPVPVTDTDIAVPFDPVAGEIPERVGGGTGAELTAIPPEVPVIVPVTVSVAVMVREPVVLSVAENVPAPFVSPALAGRVAEPSVLVK